ncbi:hypothetical protein [Acinetobacter soli]|uniref:hypothetical protein n=1 Tax=Acinetobacter soli TaxID=487316 RepID=UPI000CE4554C|nr:hypothetical protein [Acinetobacter soli]PPB85797.1 hypothetical protein AsoHEU7_13025 [Acinetobacter soli]
MIFFVLLVYSEKYYEKALYELNELAEKISSNSNYKLLVVNNNNNLDLSKFGYLRSKIDFIEGDNTGFEFSGWDVATTYLKTNYNISNSYIAYANDTFCHHRNWDCLTKKKFIHEFKKMIKESKRGICGEVNSFNRSFELNNCILNSWVSSYLFIISSNILLDYNFKFDNAKKYYSYWVLNITKEKIYFSEEFSIHLSYHLNRWLFPKSKKGWYKAKNATIEEKRNKLYSILNEKLLTANVLNRGGAIYDVNDFMNINLFKRLKNFFKWQSKIES